MDLKSKVETKFVKRLWHDAFIKELKEEMVKRLISHLLNMRKSGKTTRTVDEAIQKLFKSGSILIPNKESIESSHQYDCFQNFIKENDFNRDNIILDSDWESGIAQVNLKIVIYNRLCAEHSGCFTYDKYSWGIVIKQLKEEQKINGAERIKLERERQIMSEGYDIEKDQRYKDGELIDAAVSYLIVDSVRVMYNDENAIPHQYPWSDESFKSNPNDRIRDLEKAGALIAAEIDRLLADKLDQELEFKKE